MKILIATGGSGGHIFPALNVSQVLKNLGHDVFLSGSFGEWDALVQERGFDIFPICSKGLSRASLFCFLDSVFLMIKAFLQSLTIIRKIRPDVVCGFGGYGSFPIVLGATLLRCPTIIHEQNVVPGKANLVLSKIAKKIAVSFNESQKYFKSSKVVCSGYPTQSFLGEKNKNKVLKKHNLHNNKITLLVFGGSQGSHHINEVVVETVPLLLKERCDVQVVHVTGTKDYLSVKEKYRSFDIPFCVFDFCDELHEMYEIADVVISRAGAGTIWELGTAKIPSILIPYPGAAAHQKENALILEELGIAKVIDDKMLSAQNLKENVLAFIAQSFEDDRLENGRKSKFFKNTSMKLANEIVRLK